MKSKKILKVISIIFAPLLCGLIVGFLTNSDSYNNFSKPPLSPPAIVFPIAWTILYLLMGISLYMVIKNGNNSKNIKSFIIQLVSNLIWPFLFFNFNLYFFSALWLVLLIFLVIDMIVNFYSTKKIAGILQFPYLLWLIFALYLNIGVAILN